MAAGGFGLPSGRWRSSAYKSVECPDTPPGTASRRRVKPSATKANDSNLKETVSELLNQSFLSVFDLPESRRCFIEQAKVLTAASRARNHIFIA